ncbi:LytR/AlgR family response regulator transcription factor [Sphingobacterium thalpophilum]|uniref:Sensory transduction protein lytR n=1 Tax=Sphingobacterium thalpophilum TaxID=259 RepID=A0A4U9VX17_9SPHI|nr:MULTISPECIES: LytTR family DNA-binding domain-containing protein [Sphingobacterium]MCW8311903.1 LytTR family DNA-binding domain-containing protein [Sphingobacterium sp. InxBP1]VTR52136.1 Sensory transduction protein lytR [Sphingobacterium thalpophilum]
MNKKPLSCLIVDDEPLAAQGMKYYLGKIADVSVVDMCFSAFEASEKLKQHQIDLVFLDINMPDISGLEWLESILSPPLVILTTAYSEYALEGYRLNVVDYLLKPIGLPRLLAAIEKAHSRKKTSPVERERRVTDLYVRHNDALVKVNLDDILFIEAMQNYIKIYTDSTIYIAHQTMVSMSEKLNGQQFYRIHKSYLINIAYISSIKGNRIFISGHELPLSKHRREDFLKRIVSL